MEQSPEEQASAKLAQHLAVAVQVAESVMRLRQQRVEREAARDRTAAGAARAERIAQHSADRLVWNPALDRGWLRKADLHELGRAWGAAAGWADSDPTAEVASRRIETRLSELVPNAMARFDELRETGWTRADAMTDVLGHVAAEAHASTAERRMFVAEPGAGAAATATSETAATGRAAEAQSRADRAAFPARGFARTAPDGLATPRPGEHAEGVPAATSLRDEQGARLADTASHRPDSSIPRATALTHRRVTDSGEPHPADIAADSHPKPFIDVMPPARRALPPTVAPTPATPARTLSR